MLAIVLVLFVASASAAYGQTVKIGTATALTGLGALIAKAGVVGMEIAVEDLNKKGGPARAKGRADRPRLEAPAGNRRSRAEGADPQR